MAVINLPIYLVSASGKVTIVSDPSNSAEFSKYVSNNEGNAFNYVKLNGSNNTEGISRDGNKVQIMHSYSSGSHVITVYYTINGKVKTVITGDYSEISETVLQFSETFYMTSTTGDTVVGITMKETLTNFTWLTLKGETKQLTVGTTIQFLSYIAQGYWGDVASLTDTNGNILQLKGYDGVFYNGNDLGKPNAIIIPSFTIASVTIYAENYYEGYLIK